MCGHAVTTKFGVVEVAANDGRVTLTNGTNAVRAELVLAHLPSFLVWTASLFNFAGANHEPGASQ
jgi:hypothetical protein